MNLNLLNEFLYIETMTACQKLLDNGLIDKDKFHEFNLQYIKKYNPKFSIMIQDFVIEQQDLEDVGGVICNENNKEIRSQTA